MERTIVAGAAAGASSNGRLSPSAALEGLRYAPELIKQYFPLVMHTVRSLYIFFVLFADSAWLLLTKGCSLSSQRNSTSSARQLTNCKSVVDSAMLISASVLIYNS